MALTVERLRVFCTVVACGSFSEAARALFTSKAAVSMHIKTLETYCGVRLLQRGSKRVAPTPEGEAFYARAREILQDIKELECLISSFSSRRRLLFGCAPSAATPSFISGLLRYFHDTANLSVDVQFSGSYDIADRVRQGKLDVGVAVTDAGFDLATLPLFTDRVVLAARAPGVTSEMLSDPEKCPPVLFYDEHCWMYRQMIQRDSGLPPRVVVINDFSALKQAVVAGVGIAFLPEWCLRKEVAQGIVSILEASGVPPRVQWSLIYPRHGWRGDMVIPADHLLGMFRKLDLERDLMPERAAT